MITSINKFRKIFESKSDLGYHVGDLTQKTDFISDKLFHARNLSFVNGSKTGHFGAGYFFFGKVEDMFKYQNQSSRKDLKQCDFSKYNLYIPNDAEDFVESVRALTNDLIKKNLEDITDEFLILLTEDLNYFGIDINLNDVTNITKQFMNDLIEQTNPDSDYLITRYLKHVGYEGIDFRNTQYDNFFLGSIIYDIKPGTVTNYITN